MGYKFLNWSGSLMDIYIVVNNMGDYNSVNLKMWYWCCDSVNVMMAMVMDLTAGLDYERHKVYIGKIKIGVKLKLELCSCLMIRGKLKL